MDERLIAEELPTRQLDGPLDNAQLYAECRRLATEQAALRPLAALVARGAEPSEVVDAVVKEVRRCLVTERGGLASTCIPRRWADAYNDVRCSAVPQR